MGVSHSLPGAAGSLWSSAPEPRSLSVQSVTNLSEAGRLGRWTPPFADRPVHVPTQREVSEATGSPHTGVGTSATLMR